MQLQMTIEDLYPATWCGRTYQEPCQATAEKTSEPSLKKRQKSQTKLPLFLDLRGSGVTAEPSWEMGGLLLGEYTMHSFGESPNEENVSHLSQILEEHPLPKYYLSDRACQGILNRASKRGKELPKELREALEQQATLSKLGGREVDSHGKKAGKGALVQTEKAGTVAATQDQTLIQAYGISSFDSEGMKSANPPAGIYKADTARTLDNNGGNPACKQGGLAIVTPIEGNGTRESHRGDEYGRAGDPSFTLNAVERHAVAVDARNGTEADVNASLQASASHNINSNNLVRVK